MRKTLFLFIAAFLYSVAAVCQFPERIIKVTPQEALDVAVKACSDNKSQYDYFISETSVKRDNGQFHAVFVDKKPGAGWEHPCAYVYVKTSRLSSEATPYHIVEEATHPKGTIKMRPIRVHDRYGSNSKFKPRVAKLNANAGEKNSFSGNTYAVILSGGLNMESNEERYWNDCSFIYQTLRNRYDVPKNNIKVIMSDGTDPSEDMKSNNGEYVSSPLDLDYDGIADIEYAATKENVKNVLKSLCTKLTDKDHLLLYVIDHGGYDTQAKQSYICLWNEEKLYPGELNEWLSTGDAGYINILMGQCHSGGFVKALKGNNRIVATACSEDELSYGCEDLPFDEFVYHWTSALNGFDAEGNQVTAQTDTLPTGALKPVTMIKAFEYANEHDMYTDGKFPYAEETPCLSYLKNSTAEKLALDTIPPTVDLCITDYTRRFIYASPYIWIRNQNDGRQNQRTEAPIVNEEHPYVYLYTKIYNRGVKPYNGEGQNLGFCWTKSSFVITIDMWKGFMNERYDEVNNNEIYGNTITTQRIKDIINPGDTIISERKHYFGGNDFDVASSEGFTMCVLAYLTKHTNRCDVPITDEGYADLFHSDKLAQNNIQIHAGKELSDSCKAVTLYNRFDKISNFSIRLLSTESSRRLLSKAEVNLNFPSSLVSSFNETQQAMDSVRMDVNITGRMRLLGSKSVIRKVQMRPQEAVPVYLTCNFNADSDNDTPETYDLDFVVVDNRTGKEVGGQRFRIKENERPAIDATLNKRQTDLGYETLSVVDCSEDVQYEWFDKDGKLVGTGSSITVPAGTDTSEYTVRITSKSDGAVIYRKSKVGGTKIIDTVTPSADYVKVSLKEKSDGPLSLQLSSTTSSMPVQSCDIAPGSTSCTMHVQNFSNGVYQMSLLKDGKVIDTRKFIK